jgi:hypothetical protein
MKRKRLRSITFRKSQPVLTSAGDALRAAQGERSVNPGDYNDLVDYAFDRMGKNIKDITPQERTALARGAKEYVKSEGEGVKAAEEVREVVRKRAGGKTMSLDELRKAAEDFVKEKLSDCVV